LGFDLAAGRNRSIWGQVYVPADAPAGLYRGTVNVQPDNLQFDLFLQVSRFRLPAQSNLRTAFGINWAPEGVPIWHGASVSGSVQSGLVEAYNRHFFWQRVTPFWPAFAGQPFYGSGGQLRLNEWNRRAAMYIGQTADPTRVRFNSTNRVVASYLDRGRGANRLDVPANSADGLLIGQDLASHGYLDTAFAFLADRPQPAEYANICGMAAQVRANRAVGESVQAGLLRTAAAEPQVSSLLGCIDEWMALVSAYDSPLSEQRRALGERTWLYVDRDAWPPYPNFIITHPPLESRMVPWLALVTSADGLWYWNTTEWSSDTAQSPYENAMTMRKGEPQNYGDGRLVYPPCPVPCGGLAVSAPVPSIRWLALREGLEDYEYVRALRELGQHQAAEALVHEIMPSTTVWERHPIRLARARSAASKLLDEALPTPTPTSTASNTPTSTRVPTRTPQMPTLTASPSPTGGLETATSTATRQPPTPTPDQRLSRNVYLPVVYQPQCPAPLPNAEVVLLMDTSSSMGRRAAPNGPTKLEAARSAAGQFVERLNLPEDKVAVIGFDSQPRLLQSLTGDRSTALRALGQLQVGAGTRLNLALDAARLELTSPRSSQNNRRAILLLSDGGLGTTRRDEVLDAAARARDQRILIFALAYGQDADMSLLGSIAGVGSRLYFQPQQPELTQIYGQILPGLPCRRE
jgi:uncharacterized protein YegL